MNTNLEALLSYPDLSAEQLTGIGRRAFQLFPMAAARVGSARRHPRVGEFVAS